MRHFFRILSIASITLLFLLTICYAKDAKQLPEWLRPQIKTGSNYLEKSRFMSSNILGVVTDIKPVGTSADIGIAGRNGAMFTDRSGQIKKSVQFTAAEKWHSDFVIMHDKRRNKPYFLGIAGPRKQKYGILDENGKEVWKKSASDITKIAYGDLYKNGDIELLVASLDRKIRVLDFTGNKLFEVSKYDVTDMCIDDATYLDRSEIIIEAGGKINLLDYKGNVLNSAPVDTRDRISYPMFIRYPDMQGKVHFLFSENINNDDKYVLMSLDGKTRVAEYKGGHYLSRAKAIMVRFNSKQKPYLALTGLILYQGDKWFGLEAVLTVLFIFNSEQKLVYHEILESRGEAIAAIPTGKADEEALLLGGDDVVWKYVLKK